MAETKYTYSIAGDTASGKVDLDKLEDEIRDSAILTSHKNNGTAVDVLDIWFNDAISAGDKTILDGIVLVHDGEPAIEVQHVDVEKQPAFAAKTVDVNGVTKKLYKRVHGVKETIADGATVEIDFACPYATAKFTGAEIFNTHIGDVLDFTVHDDADNTYSGAPGSNYQLNKFGFAVQMPPDRYKNTSNYDADVYLGMIIRCAYTNNSGASKDVSMNVWLHEVKT